MKQINQFILSIFLSSYNNRGNILVTKIQELSNFEALYFCLVCSGFDAYSLNGLIKYELFICRYILRIKS